METTLRTDRLLLRPFRDADAGRVRDLAGAREIADTTMNIPHPYPPGAALAFIRQTREAALRRDGYTFAVERRAEGDVIACVGLRLEPQHLRAELGYWVGLPYWNAGYGSEAAAAALRFGFEALGLGRIYATALTRNPASARVMQKIGLRYEGTLRGHVRKHDVAEDLVMYGLTRDDYLGGAG